LRFLLGDHVGDTARRELSRGGAQIALEPQVFDVLVYLLQNRERVVSKDDLLASVWGRRIVSDATLDSRTTAARRAVGDSGAAQTLIRTFARKGVRFIGEVREEAKPAAFAPEMAAESGRPELVLPAKPSIAVLPFANISCDAEQEYFVDGMVEEIITALCRIRWLFVIARNSSFTYKGQATDVKRVSRELGVRYVLEGSVRRGGNRVRISSRPKPGPISGRPSRRLARRCVRLAGQGRDLCCRGHLADVASRRNRPLGAPPDERSQRLRLISARLCDRQIREALALLEQAIRRDPQYGPALGFAAFCCHYLATDASAPDREAIRQKGIEFGGRGVEVAGGDPGVLSNAAMALAVFGEDIDAMMLVVDRALALNPSYARGWHISGFLRLWAGQTDLAIEHTATALRLSPRAQAANTSFLERNNRGRLPSILPPSGGI